MASLMMEENPFVTTGRIKPAYFCDRTQESRQLIGTLTNGNNLVLFSLRRMGKTELIAHCFNSDAVRTACHTVYVDILLTSSLQEFTYALGRLCLRVFCLDNKG